jgi:hypothetical protein
VPRSLQLSRDAQSELLAVLAAAERLLVVTGDVVDLCLNYGSRAAETGGS